MLGTNPLASAPLASGPIDTTELGIVLAELGQFTFTGNDVRLQRSWGFIASAGAFTVTGNAVGLVYTVSSVAIGQISLVGSTSTQARFSMTQNFVMHQGDDKVLVFTIKDRVNVVVNIVGCTIKWQCAKSFGKTSSISKATGGSGISITDGANGQFSVTLDAADTASLVGNFVHEAEITFTDGTKQTVVQGTMTLKKVVIEAT